MFHLTRKKFSGVGNHTRVIGRSCDTPFLTHSCIRSYNNPKWTWKSIDYEERLRSAAGWEEFTTIAKEEGLKVWYCEQVSSISENKNLEKNAIFFFVTCTLCFIGGLGYIFHSIWNENSKKQIENQNQQESSLLTRKKIIENLDIYDMKENTKKPIGSCNIDLLSTFEFPTENFLQITITLNKSDKIYGICIQANLVTEYHSKDDLDGKSIEFISIKDLELIFEKIQFNKDENTIEIPLLTCSNQFSSETQSFTLKQSKSSDRCLSKLWREQILFPFLGISLFSSSFTYFWTKFHWKRQIKNSNFILRCIHKPWSQALALGSRTGLVTSFATSIIAFIGLIYSYKRNYFVYKKENENIVFDSADSELRLGDVNDYAYLTKLGFIFVSSVLLASSVFVIPMNTLAGRLVVQRVYNEMMLVKPRSTIALRKYAGNKSIFRK